MRSMALLPMKRSVATKMNDVRNANSPAVAGEVRRRLHHVGHRLIHRNDLLNITQKKCVSNFFGKIHVDR